MFLEKQKQKKQTNKLQQQREIQDVFKINISGKTEKTSFKREKLTND